MCNIILILIENFTLSSILKINNAAVRTIFLLQHFQIGVILGGLAENVFAFATKNLKLFIDLNRVNSESCNRVNLNGDFS